jgi:hypothetical protein
MNIQIIHNNPIPPIRKNLHGGELFAYANSPNILWIAGLLNCQQKDIDPNNGDVMVVYESEINHEVIVYGRIKVSD